MNIKGRILQSLRPRRHGLLLRPDIKSFGSPSQISVALNTLIKDGLLERLDRGIYAKPSKVKEIGREALLASAIEMGKSMRYKFRPTLKRAVLTPTARHVKNLAKSNGVTHEPTYADQWANAVTNLAGDKVVSDEIDNLLVSLTRSQIITPKEMVSLIVKHHRDLKRV